MGDILEGLVLEVVDGEVLQLEVEHVQAQDAGAYHAREWVRVSSRGRLLRSPLLDDDATAHVHLSYEHRRVRCFVSSRDAQGRLVGEIEVLSRPPLDEALRTRR